MKATSRQPEQMRLSPILSDATSHPSRHHWAPACPGKVFETYWRFAAERQLIYFRRLQGLPAPWTKDPILGGFRFTNAYRAADRVSQYLIRNVIYRGVWSPEDLFFRILLFKLFNKVETWKLLERVLGPLSFQTYRFEAYDKVLTEGMSRGAKIYSAAYIMPSARSFGHPKKHRNHLRLLEAMMSNRVTVRVGRCTSMKEVFELLRSYVGIGDFLAYQYAIDLNYSELTEFSEMEFVVPGPGARDGIRKCFPNAGGLADAEIIKLVCDRQTGEFSRSGFEFEILWGRPLQLIDCQNLFCEVDKYARLAHPDVRIPKGRSRIKQKYRENGTLERPWFPPKWGINERVEGWWERNHAGD